MFNKNGGADLKYTIFKDYNVSFDEKANTFGTLRKVQWLSNGKEPDESKSRLEIRKVTINNNGEEQLLKGYSFSTDEGAHELTEILVNEGFGKTKNIIKSLAKREDFRDVVENISNDDDDKDTSNTIFDMRDYLYGEIENK